MSVRKLFLTLIHAFALVWICGPANTFAADLAPDNELFSSQVATVLPSIANGHAHQVSLISQQGNSNEIRAEQIGRANLLSLDQKGGRNLAQLNQQGCNNEILVSQLGSANLTNISQVGSSHVAHVYQSGTNNQAVILQIGSSQIVTVIQSGNNGVARVTQRN
jgi:hypothetical protein